MKKLYCVFIFFIVIISETFAYDIVYEKFGTNGNSSSVVLRTVYSSYTLLVMPDMAVERGRSYDYNCWAFDRDPTLKRTELSPSATDAILDYVLVARRFSWYSYCNIQITTPNGTVYWMFIDASRREYALYGPR
jgi:hypothetical protein